MTGQGVERTPRTAYPMPSVPPAGVSALMPPHIQGAERRTESRARRTRWGLRALVVGGLAGAAWLLTGAAAHAADRADGPTGPLLGSVVDGGAIAPVTGLLTAAARPLEAVVPAHQGVLDVPERVLTRPAETLAEVTHGYAGNALGGVDRTLQEVAGPIRLTGGPTITRQLPTPAAEPAIRTPRPVAGRPQHPAVAPVDEVPRATPVALPVSRTPISKVFRPPAAAPTASVPVRHGKKASTPSAHRHRTARSASTVPAAAQEGTPGGDGPAAPLQLHLGDVSGTPTSGSGTPTEGGSPAFLPAAIADSTMACRLLPIATDVEVRRHDAEAPTVSPD